jgi:PIN domain nuclease of toxin-antitoxin system
MAPVLRRMSKAAAEAIEASDDLKDSPMVRLELQHLYEIGRVKERAAVVVDQLVGTLGLTVCDAPFATVVLEAEKLTRTRDSFDRLIVAQAAHNNATLVTKDATLHAHYPAAVW